MDITHLTLRTIDNFAGLNPVLKMMFLARAMSVIQTVGIALKQATDEEYKT